LRKAKKLSGKKAERTAPKYIDAAEYPIKMC